MYYLDDAQLQTLINLPETGMGYQLVEVTTLANRREVGVAYNAEIVLQKDEPELRALFQAFASGQPIRDHGQAVREVRLLSPVSVAYRALRMDQARGERQTMNGPAKHAPLVTTQAGEVFRRFCAYQNDCRVRPDGSLLPGTYATTEEDARQVRRGQEVIVRYALPNPESTVHGLSIKPVINTPLKYGLAEPAFGQTGGGADVLFPRGTAIGTVSALVKVSSV